MILLSLLFGGCFLYRIFSPLQTLGDCPKLANAWKVKTSFKSWRSSYGQSVPDML